MLGIITDDLFWFRRIQIKNHMNPVQQLKTTITNAISGKIGKGGRRMWGFSLEFWESVFFWATGLAAIAGAVSVASAFVAGIVGYQVTDRVLKESEVKIADANARAEEAKAVSAAANARAVEANLALEKFKAPRSIDPHEMQLLVSQLRKFTGQEYQVTTFWDLKEALGFSNQLHEALQKAGWKCIPHGEGGSFLLEGFLVCRYGYTLMLRRRSRMQPTRSSPL